VGLSKRFTHSRCRLICGVKVAVFCSITVESQLFVLVLSETLIAEMLITKQANLIYHTPYHIAINTYAVYLKTFCLDLTSKANNSPHGFDHNFVIAESNNQSNQFKVNHFVARFEHEKSGRFLEVYSNQPGVQFYTGEVGIFYRARGLRLPLT